MELNEKVLEKLKETVGNLREILEAKHIRKMDATEQVKDENEKFEEVIKVVHPQVAERKMKWDAVENGASINDIIGGMGEFKNAKIQGGRYIDRPVGLGGILKAICPENFNRMKKEIRDYVEKIVLMSEGDTAQGGYCVPAEYGNEIIKLERDNSIARQLCRIFPMASLTRLLPRQLTNVTVTWTAEATAKTKTKPTFDRVTQTAKKLAAIVALTDELLEDNNVQLDQFVMELIAEAMAIEEDRVVFAGNTGAGDPFMGVLYAVGVNATTMVGANATHDDFINLFMSINAKYRTGASAVTSTTGLRIVMKMKDANGNYLWQMPAGDQPAKIWTFPYQISDQIPVNLGAGVNETAILFGNWKKYVYISDRGGYEVKSSISAYDSATSESAFMMDETWFRFKKRMSIDVALPGAMAKMSFK